MLRWKDCSLRTPLQTAAHPQRACIQAGHNNTIRLSWYRARTDQMQRFDARMLPRRMSSTAPSGVPRRSSSGEAQGGRASSSHQGLSGDAGYAGYRTAGHRGADGHRRPNGNAQGR